MGLFRKILLLPAAHHFKKAGVSESVGRQPVIRGRVRRRRGKKQKRIMRYAVGLASLGCVLCGLLLWLLNKPSAGQPSRRIPLPGEAAAKIGR